MIHRNPFSVRLVVNHSGKSGFFGSQDQDSMRHSLRKPFKILMDEAVMLERIPALDVAKGIAILLVAFFHTAAGFINSGHFAPGYAYTLSYTLTYGFHVQIFFIIAGFLCFKKASDWRFQVKRGVNLYYAYLVWSLASLVLASLSGAANHKLGLVDLATLPVIPIQHYWFLLALLLYTLALCVLRNAMALLIATVVLASLASLQLDWIDLAYFFPFMALGALFQIENFVPRASRPGGIAAAALAVAGAVLAVHLDVAMRMPAFYLFSLAACYALYVGSDWLSARAIGKALAYIGERSMPIYLAHVIFAAATRTAIFKYAHVLDNIYGIMAAFIVSVAGPLLLFEALERLGLAKALGFAPLLREKPLASASPVLSALAGRGRA